MNVPHYICCPSCKSDLIGVGNQFHCLNQECDENYRIINSIPVLISKSNQIFTFESFNTSPTPFFGTKNIFKKIVKHLVPKISHSIPTINNYKYLVDLFKKKEARVLIIGFGEGGSWEEIINREKNLEIVKTDVSVTINIDFTCDAHQLPFKSESFDLVIATAVLEHVANAEECVKEIYRVLRNEGIVYSEVPFMQQVHGGQYDFVRFTHSGQRLLFKSFFEIKSGQIGSVGMSLAWSIEAFIKGIIPFKNIALFISLLLRYVSFMLKYIDYLAIKFNPNSLDGASGFYFIGKKTSDKFKMSCITEYYMNSRL